MMAFVASEMIESIGILREGVVIMKLRTGRCGFEIVEPTERDVRCVAVFRDYQTNS
jgi:hypothetical protein